MDRIDAELALGNAHDLVAELNTLVDANPYQERLLGQLMLALYRTGRQADSLQAFRDGRERLSDELGLEPTRSLQQLERAILIHDESLDAFPRPHTDGSEIAICPFKGLASFGIADAKFFCGRERLVDDLVARLAEGTLVGVIGPSGIGKSSPLRAGLLRALASGALPGSEHWPIVVVRPGAHPAAELEAARSDLPRSPDDRYVVAVDQFEELFTVCSDEEERSQFVDALMAIADDPRRHGVVAIALRADFYGRCATYPAFARLLSGSHVLVGPMQSEELERAVVVPAERAGLEVEPNLVSALVGDVAGEPGGLPLLSTTLLELWRRRDGSTLRLTDYQAAGGVRGAVGRLAEATYAGLSDDGKAIARALMLRLAAGDVDNAVRRRLPAAELTRGRADVQEVLDALVEARLLTADDGSVEVAHEALLREWPRMRSWLEEERESRRLEAHLRATGVAHLPAPDSGAKQSAFDVSTGGDIGALAWSRTGGLVVSGNEGHVQLWDVSGRPHLTHVLHGMGSINKYREAVTALAYSPDGSLVAAGDVNHTAGPVPWRYGTVAVWTSSPGGCSGKCATRTGG